MRFFVKLISLCGSALLTLTVLGLATLTGLYLYYSPQLPDSHDLQQIELQVPLRIYSRDRQLIAEYGTKRRRPVTLDQVPEHLREAFIAIEDARYYEHQGIDFIGLARALYSVVSTGHASQGASTITMQLARNTFLDNRKTLERKLKETLLAFKLERTLDKNEILELYLNKIYLGNRAHGIAAAAETYYGKEHLEDLTLAQMAMIAGLPKAPSRYNPIANPKRAMIRRDYILKRMLELQYIRQNEYNTAIREPNTARVHKPEIETYAPYLAEMVRSAIVKQYQDKAYTQGYHVYTTLDSDIQQHAANALRKALLDYDRRHGYHGAEDQIVLEDYAGREEWLDKLSTYTPVDGMQIALVTQAGAEQAELLLLNEETITLTLADVSWARPFIKADRRGRKPRRVTDVLYPGDIVRVSQRADPKNNDQNPADKRETAQPWQLTQIPRVGGALVVLDPDNGAIRAVMGGFDYYLSKFNRATQAMRQPGSSFKPIIYSAAMTKGLKPTSIVNDAPITVPGTDWRPKNYGGRYIGPTTLAEALAKSRNLVSIRLLRSTGISYTIDYATRFGYQRQNLPPNLTLALGTGLTTPLQMATAYATFANGGFKVDSHFINRIEDNHGRVLYDASTTIKRACGDDKPFCPLAKKAQMAAETGADTTDKDGQTKAETAQTDTPETAEPDNTEQAPAASRIMDSRTHQYIVSMMQGVTQFGTAARAGRVLKRKDIAGKTGTTNDQRDSWFCGFTPDYVAVAWAGFDDMAELGSGETSTKIAVPMWIDLMQQVLKDTPQKPWKQYGDKLRTVKLDADTGRVAHANSRNVIEEKLVEEPAHTEMPVEFIFTDVQPANPAARQAQQWQQGQQAFWEQPVTATPSPQPTPPPPGEAVEIPEQIF
ncbi:MAG: penicillin-binding protein 1A [Thiothrix nivea]|nr:MAG: penicillin-binding protein 1A [Thiothrix nivea]